MKRMTGILFTALLATLLVACGGEKTADDTMAKTAGDAADQMTTAATGTLEEAREQFVGAMKSKVSEIEEKLSDFDTRLAELNPMARKAAEKPLQVAHEKVDAVNDQLANLTEAPLETWSDYKPAAEKAFTELQDSFAKVSGLF